MDEITKYNDIGFRFENETLWGTINHIATLFGRDRTTILKHKNDILNDGELDKSTCAKFAHVGGKESPEWYNLDMIIAIGYRVHSKKATKFRIWATNILKQYIKDGYVIDEKRLAQNPDKLNELAAKIRELRNNEKSIYQKVRDCLKILATDYDKQKREEISAFYALLQDKFHYAILGMTAAKIKMDRANHTQDNMGLQFFDGIIPTLTEAQVGKNYVLKDELYRMHLLSEQFLSLTESLTLNNKRLTIKELYKKLDEILRQNEYPVFPGHKVKLKDEAERHVKQEFALYEKLHKLKYSGIEVDLERFYDGEYDDIFNEYDLEHKRLSTLYEKYIKSNLALEQERQKELENKQQQLSQEVKQIQADNLDFKENNNFEQDLEKIITTPFKK